MTSTSYRRLKRREPAKWKARTIKASLHRLGIELTVDEILAWMKKTPTCTYCGDPIKPRDYSIDHIIPRSRGGKDKLHNLHLVHKSCNLAKGNLLDEEYRDLLRYLDDKPDVKRIVLQRLKASGYLFNH
jgi:5-methylcytosine-specific restriction endonuclease McrA